MSKKPSRIALFTKLAMAPEFECDKVYVAVDRRKE